MKKQNETIANVKVNESANVNNNNVDNVDNTTTESANTESESKQESTTTTAPTAEQISSAKVEQKHQTEIANRYKLDAPTEVERTKFVGATVLGVWRAPKDVKKNGDKTFFKVYFDGTIYDGYTATEFCDTVGIERKHRNGNTPKATTLLDKLTALKSAIEAIDSKESDFVNFAKIVAQKIESEKLESERTGFLAKYEMVVGLFDMITEATFAKKYNSDDLALALKLGYKFSDTPTDNKETESKETESK